MARGYFCAYHSYLKAMEPLTDEECGRLFRALLDYSQSGTVPQLEGNERFVFPTMQDQIDRDAKRYSDRCKKNRNNILQRYTNVDDGIRSYTNATKEKEKEKEKDKENKEKVIADAITKKKIEEFKASILSGTPAEKPDKPTRPRFVPPDETEVIAFFRESGSDKEEAEAFRDYYEANGWKVGKNSMKDWKAAARGWIRRSGQHNREQEKTSSSWDVLNKAAERVERGDFSFMEV